MRRELSSPATALPPVPGLDELWLRLGNDEDRRSLSARLRGPIARILGYGELLDADSTLNPDQAHRARVVHESARELQRLLADMSWAL